MAHEGIFATSDEIIVKAGENYDSVNISEARINDLASQSESVINCVCRFNYSDTYAGLNVDIKRILSAASSAWCGIMMISYNMAVYTTRIEAEDMVNILRDDFLRNISLLRDKKVVDFINAA